MIRAHADGAEIDCYSAELEAATASARYWQAHYGTQGKLRLTHPSGNVMR